MFIATLIAASGFNDSLFREFVHQFGMDSIATVEGVRWIDEGYAADLEFSAPDTVTVADCSGMAEAIADRIYAISPHISGCGNLALDVIVQPADYREKRLLVADMDSTMITVECIDELADYAGIKPQIAAITEAAMRGELDFEAALDARVALLAGLPESVIAECLAERVKIMPGAKTLVRTMRARGGHAILVSGGFTRFADPVAAEIGFDRASANVLEIADGVLTGQVAKPIVGSDTKLQTLLAASAEFALLPEQVLAVGDGANDLAMIQAAGLGVAYHAKPIVAAAAAARVDHGDLTTLLYAQGIPRAEWVSQ